MVLGELTECWICWESKAYAQSNPNLTSMPRSPIPKSIDFGVG